MIVALLALLLGGLAVVIGHPGTDRGAQEVGSRSQHGHPGDPSGPADAHRALLQPAWLSGNDVTAKRIAGTVTFERAVRAIPVRRWLGLTATPYRRDGLQALMAMHCGPIRHTMTTPAGAALRTLDLIVHETNHRQQTMSNTYRQPSALLSRTSNGPQASATTSPPRPERDATVSS